MLFLFSFVSVLISKVDGGGNADADHHNHHLAEPNLTSGAMWGDGKDYDSGCDYDHDYDCDNGDD